MANKYSNYTNLLRVARLYYKEELTQQEIANKLNISRPSVSNLLRRAKKKGIVKIEVVDIKNKNFIIDMENKLVENYNLDAVRIVDTNKENEDLKRDIGEKAAIYFDKEIESNLKIGVAWGFTLKYMAENLHQNNNIRNLEVIPILGGSGNLESEVNSNEMCKKIINKYHGESYSLYAPVIVDNIESRNTLITNQEIKNIMEKAKNVDIAIVGIGTSIDSSLLLKTGYFKDDDITELKRQNAVGDICAQFFDSQGKVCKASFNNKVVGLNLNEINNIDKVIGLAGGENKIRSILAALRGNHIDVLITDINTGKSILEIENKNSNTIKKASLT